MPTIPTYIRNGDYVHWVAIKDRPGFLHSVLNGPVYAAWLLAEDGEDFNDKKEIESPTSAYNTSPTRTQEVPDKPEKKKVTGITPKVIKTPEEAQEVVTELVPPMATNIDRFSNGLCKLHGVPLDSRGKCLQKGCRYA